MKEKWFAFFKSGKQTDSQERTKEFKKEDLDKIVETYNNGKNDAPIVIGHPKSNAPAWGWIESLKRSGEYLLAKPKDLAPEFKEWVGKKMFKKVSMSIGSDGALRHIGFLGAAAPAVKGLPDVSFTEAEYSEFEFAEYGEMGVVAGMFQNIREFFIEKFGKEVADKIISSWDVDYLRDSDKPAVKQGQPEFQEPDRKEDLTMSDKTFTEDEVKAKLKEEKSKLEKDFSEQLSKKDEDLKSEKKKTADFEGSQRKKKIADFVEQMKKEGKLAPAEEKLGLNVEFLETLDDQEVHEFTDSSGEGAGTKKETQLSRVMNYLENRGKVIEFSEIATEGKKAPAAKSKHDHLGDKSKFSQEQMELHDKAAAYAEQNKCSYEEALGALETK